MYCTYPLLKKNCLSIFLAPSTVLASTEPNAFRCARVQLRRLPPLTTRTATIVASSSRRRSSSARPARAGQCGARAVRDDVRLHRQRPATPTTTTRGRGRRLGRSGQRAEAAPPPPTATAIFVVVVVPPQRLSGRRPPGKPPRAITMRRPRSLDDGLGCGC